MLKKQSLKRNSLIFEQPDFNRINSEAPIFWANTFGIKVSCRVILDELIHTSFVYENGKVIDTPKFQHIDRLEAERELSFLEL